MRWLKIWKRSKPMRCKIYTVVLRKRLCFVIAAFIYGILTFNSAYYLARTYLWTAQNRETDANVKNDLVNHQKREYFVTKDISTGQFEDVNQQNEIVILGKAAIGLYLWQHILNGTLVNYMNGWQTGVVNYHNIKFRFHTGPAVVPSIITEDTHHAVLVANGRADDKVQYAKSWLRELHQLKFLHKLIVVLLGSESCDNRWIDEYLSLYSSYGKVHAVLVVYDDPRVDNRVFYQWPLGVATYRDFPVYDTSSDTQQRNYICNLMATVYKNSSREALLRVIHQYNYTTHCYVKPRLQWQAKETEASLHEYVTILHASHTTLHPVGMNAECYRLYEAMMLASIPILEDPSDSQHYIDNISHGYHTSNYQHYHQYYSSGAMSHGANHTGVPSGVSSDVVGANRCTTHNSFRLLKQHAAPVYWIRSWKHDLPVLMERLIAQSEEERYVERERLRAWYAGFKANMAEVFVNVVKDKFELT